MEYVAINRRTVVVNLSFGVYFAFASTALPWLAYYMSDWRFFAYATAFPLLSAIITPWILPESARYVLTNILCCPEYSGRRVNIFHRHEREFGMVTYGGLWPEKAIGR